MDSSQSAPKVTESAPKNKSSKGPSTSSSTKPFLRDTTQLFSLDPMDHDESIWVMIEFIAHHPISVPLTKILELPIPLRLLHISIDRIKIENDILETWMTSDHIVPAHKSTFCKQLEFWKTLMASRFKNHLLKSSNCFLITLGMLKSLRIRSSRNLLFQAFGQSSCISFLEVYLGNMEEHIHSTISRNMLVKAFRQSSCIQLLEVCLGNIEAYIQ